VIKSHGYKYINTLLSQFRKTSSDVMKPPCEIIVGKILPSIRAAIVKSLIEDYNMKQTEISVILGISQSAVSQYYTSARAVDDSPLSLFPEIIKYSTKRIFH